MRYDQIIDVRLLAPLATAMAIFVSVILWMLNQRRKQISYKVLSQEENSAVVQVVNSGHLPVVPGDYYSPLSISPGPGARVVSASVVATVPGDLELRCRRADGSKRSLIEKSYGSEVVLVPILLNDGDSITVRMEMEESRGGIRVNAHINGVRKVVSWRPNTLVYSLFMIVGGFIIASALLMADVPAIIKYGLSDALPTILFSLLGYTLLSAGLYGRKVAKQASLEPVV